MEIQQLDLPLQSKLYERLTTPENYCYLQSKNPYEIQGVEYFAFAARELEKPIGLILGSSLKGTSHAEVHSLFVDKEYHEKGVEQALMAALEKSLKANQYAIATMLVEGNQSINYPGWHHPEPFILRYHFKAAEFHPPWFEKAYQFPESLKLFPWKELTNKDRTDLKRREEQWSFPYYISPFLDEEHIEYSNSFGLKINGRVIGWMIVHRLKTTTIRYSSLYIEAQYQFLGLSIQLLIHAIKTNQELIKNGFPAIWSLFDLNLEQTEMNWQHFITRRLAPYANSHDVIAKTWKEL